MEAKEKLKPRGKVEIFVTKGKPIITEGEVLYIQNGIKVFNSYEICAKPENLLDFIKIENLIVSEGKNKLIKALMAGAVNPIGRMCIGDRGTIPSDSTIPKIPAETAVPITTLYNEIHRGDIDGIILDVGASLSVHEVKFVKTFSATEIPLASFSNQAIPVINEVGLITYDPGVAALPRSAVNAPTPPPADENLFSIRTFKSVPFEAANEISVTIRYTVSID